MRVIGFSIRTWGEFFAESMMTNGCCCSDYTVAACVYLAV